MKTWASISTASNGEILKWAEGQPWAQAMATCPQDAQWHGEGNVWTHTQLVWAELERPQEWPSLDRPTQLKLLLTALFHDAGKPAATAPDRDTGRLRSPKHAIFGAALARHVLRDLGCDLATREQIAALVRYHGRPPYLLEKSSPEHEVIWLSWLANNRLLYLEPPVATILCRNRRRVNPVPENVILGLLEKLDPPTRAESHRLTTEETASLNEM